MKIIKLEKNKRSDIINEAVKVLKNGGVIAYPTETAYGLGADFFKLKSIKKVYQIKGRDYKKPLSVIVSNLSMAKKLVKFNKTSLDLAKKYWPGPLTLVLKDTRYKHLFVFAQSRQDTNKSQILNSKIQTLGLRVSSNELATAIVKKFGGPITATSANVSGKGECYTVDQIIKQFRNKKNKPDLVINAGRLPKKKVSTIVKCLDDKIVVLRNGDIKVTMK
jgi:L-threonylcarbamoyladenylate synthase